MKQFPQLQIPEIQKGSYNLDTLRALRKYQQYWSDTEVPCELFILEEGLLFASNWNQILIPIQKFIDQFVKFSYSDQS